MSKHSAEVDDYSPGTFISILERHIWCSQAPPNTRTIRQIFGREIKSQTLVATEYEPERLISYTSVIPILGQVIGGYTFDSVDGGTRVSRWTEAGLGRGEGLFGPLAARLFKRAQATELANLRRLIEARA